MKKQKQTPAATLLRYCVGIDVGKDTLHLCVSDIDADGKVIVRGSRKFPNRVPTFELIQAWCAKHCKDNSLPVRYLMESTGVYHEGSAPAAGSLAPVPRRPAGQRRATQQGQILPEEPGRGAGATIRARTTRSTPGVWPRWASTGPPERQNLQLWQPLSKQIYTLRMLTRQHQRLQELKNQRPPLRSQNQQHAIMHSQIPDPFIIKQLNVLIKLYDKQIEQIGGQIEKLLAKDAVLKAKIEQLCQIKGLGVLSVATIVAETNGFTGFDRTGAPECPPAREFFRVRCH